MTLFQPVLDAVLVGVALALSFLLRFDLTIPYKYQALFTKSLPVIIIVNIAAFFANGLYKRWWRYTSVRDAIVLIRSTVTGVMASLIAVFLMFPRPHYHAYPRSVLIIDWLLTFLLVGGMRFVVRSFYQRPQKESQRRVKPVIVAGAGDAADLMLREMFRNPVLGHKPVGLLDDDPRKRGISIHGVKVLGNLAEMLDVCERAGAEEVIIAMPTAPGSVVKDIVYKCEKAGIVCKTMPGLDELIKGTVPVSQLRDVQVEDILGREQITVNIKEISDYLKGKRVMVTGAGGSIGSELCRQISRILPEELIMVDHAENNLFNIEQELVSYGVTRFSAFIADIKCEQRMRQIFGEKKPEVVFHAAAYKHVPLMECNPWEAFNNNTLATGQLAALSGEYGVKRFVLISTDKAVKPATLMGMSKSLAERAIESLADEGRYRTKYMMVRFGNVLGSSGSVVPIFKRQIAAGGPVTITHEEMTRYFMTIPEAVQLVIQAGALGGGGEIFVLDMGKPVRIMDLARNMIELSGHDPEKDIKIEVVGIRPGEKLHEELFNAEEEVGKTSHPKIRLARRKPVEKPALDVVLEDLKRGLYTDPEKTLKPLLKELFE